jgi:hypothetical protein
MNALVPLLPSVIIRRYGHRRHIYQPILRRIHLLLALKMAEVCVLWLVSRTQPGIFTSRGAVYTTSGPAKLPIFLNLKEQAELRPVLRFGDGDAYI